MLEDITRSFTIAFTMRSGSNAICNLLARNGLGAPTEWFQSPLAACNGESWLDAFVRLVNEHQAEGVFGSKMSHNHRAALDECLRSAIPGYRRLDEVLPGHRWVWLVRKNKVLQAISLCRAEQSGQWAMTGPDDAKPVDFDYDFFHVLSRIMMIQGGELAWDLYFQQNGIEPFLIVYEDFFQNLDCQLPRLIDYLGGLPPGRSLDMSEGFVIQRDAMNRALERRFISDFTRVGETSFANEIGEPFDTWVRFFFQKGWRMPTHFDPTDHLY